MFIYIIYVFKKKLYISFFNEIILTNERNGNNRSDYKSMYTKQSESNFFHTSFTRPTNRACSARLEPVSSSIDNRSQSLTGIMRRWDSPRFLGCWNFQDSSTLVNPQWTYRACYHHRQLRSWEMKIIEIRDYHLRDTPRARLYSHLHSQSKSKKRVTSPPSPNQKVSKLVRKVNQLLKVLRCNK